MMDDRNDLLAQYHNVTHKLKKKRILKKPNVAEAGQQFESLGISFEREDLTHYSGLCYQAAAKCQNSLGNTLEEGLLLLKGNRQFMSSYLENINDRCIPNKSFLNHSYLLYRDCLARLKDCEELNDQVKEVFMASIILEMADNLNQKSGLAAEAYKEYKKALELLSNSPVEKINCFQRIFTLKLKLGDYKECLNLINDIVEETKHLPESGFKSDTLKDSEITRIFLLLILRPTVQQISPVAASSLEKYAWVETSSTNDMNDLTTTLKNQELSMLGEDLFLNLQSLVMACQYCDTEGLELLEKDLTDYLSNEQKSLLRTLIKEYKT